MLSAIAKCEIKLYFFLDFKLNVKRLRSNFPITFLIPELSFGFKIKFLRFKNTDFRNGIQILIRRPMTSTKNNQLQFGQDYVFVRM